MHPPRSVTSTASRTCGLGGGTTWQTHRRPCQKQPGGRPRVRLNCDNNTQVALSSSRTEQGDNRLDHVWLTAVDPSGPSAENGLMGRPPERTRPVVHRQHKRDMLAEYDAADGLAHAVLLRRAGLYSSQLSDRRTAP